MPRWFSLGSHPTRSRHTETRRQMLTADELERELLNRPPIGAAQSVSSRCDEISFRPTLMDATRSRGAASSFENSHGICCCRPNMWNKTA